MAAHTAVRRENLASTWPFHPVLLALFPVFSLYAGNRYEVSIAEVMVPLATVLVVTVATLVVLTSLLRDSRRAGIIVSAGVVVVMMFGPIVALLPTVEDAMTALMALVVGVGAFMGTALIIAWRAGPRLTPITLLLNVVSSVMVVLAVVPAVDGIATELQDVVDTRGPQLVHAAEGGAPERDIYHIVLDRYGSESALGAYGGIDNSAFIGWLRENGFHVVDDANANYTKTTMSLGATLGMRLLDETMERVGPESRSLAPAVRRIRRNRAGEFLQEHGYEYVHIGSWYPDTRYSDIADRTYNSDGVVDFGSTLYEMTILPILLERSNTKDGFKRMHADAADFQMSVLHSLVDDPGPKYVFAHVLLPHDPYVFLEDGTFDPESSTFETQLDFVNRRMRALLGSLLALPEDERPIIVLQADEGPYPMRYRGDGAGFDWSDATDDEVLIKFGILNAMYLPGPEGEQPLRSNLSAVNTYPELFRRYFGMVIGDEPDRVLASDPELPYDLLDITERVNALEAEVAAESTAIGELEGVVA